MFGQYAQASVFKQCKCCKYNISRTEWRDLHCEGCMVEDNVALELKNCPKCAQPLWHKIELEDM